MIDQFPSDLTKMGIVLYGNTGYVAVWLKQASHDLHKRSLARITYKDDLRGDNIEDALGTVYTRLLLRSRDISQTIILFVTKAPSEEAVRNAQILLENGKQIIVIGIGNDLKRKDFVNMVKRGQDVVILPEDYTGTGTDLIKLVPSGKKVFFFSVGWINSKRKIQTSY